MTTLEPTTPFPPAVAELPRPKKADLFGVDVSLAGPDEVVEQVISWAQQGRSAAVDFMAVHSLMTAVRDPAYREAVKGFDIVGCDGQPIRWALNHFYKADLNERVYGPHTMLKLCEEAAEKNLPIYLYGGKPDVLEKLTFRLSELLPELKIVGAESPPFRKLTDDEHDATTRRINTSGARMVFIGIGCPKQELFAARHLGKIQAVMLCVGAAFDFHAGTLKMAPTWMQDRGLEWLYRLSSEPRRLWKRYFVTNSLFIAFAARKAVFGR